MRPYGICCITPSLFYLLLITLPSRSYKKGLSNDSPDKRLIFL